MTDSRDRFTGIASQYARHRPGYPPELVDWIFALFPDGRPTRAADLGCGTGISTRLLAARGLDVVGIEPNDDMRAAAEAEGGARYVRASAEETGLAAASVDLVTAAQAFHWFDGPRAFAEIGRVLRPRGWFAAFWNVRAQTPLLEDFRELMRRFSEEWGRLKSDEDAIDEIRRLAAGDVSREASFGNVQHFDADGLVGRAFSASYVHHGVADRAAFEAELRALFARHERGGRIEFRYVCRVVAWQPR